MDTFKNIFEKLKLGTIEPNDVEIFKEVADFDKDGQINLDDFRKILNYKPGQMDEENQDEEGEDGEDGEGHGNMDDSMEDDEAHRM